MIPKGKLKNGSCYLCEARNFEVGQWDAENDSFMYLRYKFGDYFYDWEQHWDDGPPYGTARPLREIS